MRPLLHDSMLEIPMTMDLKNTFNVLDKKQLYLVVVCAIGGLLLGAVGCIILGSVSVCIFIFIAYCLLIFGLRYIYLNERYYKQKYKELKETKGVYSTNVLWNIYDVTKESICYLRNGYRAYFVMFDRDIIIGKENDSIFKHHEAIANAYQAMVQKNISCMHIDYMDIISKDKRLEPAVDSMLKTSRPDLRQLLGAIFDYQYACMSRVHSTFDVYAFYFNYDDKLFLDDINLILRQFMEANYKRYRVLGVSGLRELAMSLYDLSEFSVNKACDSVFARNNSRSKFVNVIEYTTNGQHIKVNPTAAEKQLKKVKSKKKVIEDNTIINLFNATESETVLEKPKTQEQVLSDIEKMSIYGTTSLNIDSNSALYIPPDNLSMEKVDFAENDLDSELVLESELTLETEDITGSVTLDSELVLDEDNIDFNNTNIPESSASTDLYLGNDNDDIDIELF